MYLSIEEDDLVYFLYEAAFFSGNELESSTGESTIIPPSSLTLCITTLNKKKRVRIPFSELASFGFQIDHQLHESKRSEEKQAPRTNTEIHKSCLNSLFKNPSLPALIPASNEHPATQTEIHHF